MKKRSNVSASQTFNSILFPFPLTATTWKAKIKLFSANKNLLGPTLCSRSSALYSLLETRSFHLSPFPHILPLSACGTAQKEFHQSQDRIVLKVRISG
jgi:hypothetical protein